MGPGPGGDPGGWVARFLGVPGAVRASRLAEKSQDKTPGVFLHGAFDVDAPGPRNTAQKSQNNQKTFKHIMCEL